MSDKNYYLNIKKALLSGFFMQTAVLQRAGHYMTTKDDQIVLLHPSTVIDHKPEWIMYNEFLLTSKNYIRTCMVIDSTWLYEVAPSYYDLDEFPDNETKRKLERALKKFSGK